MPINHQNNESRYINPRTQRRSVRKVLYPGGAGSDSGPQGVQSSASSGLYKVLGQANDYLGVQAVGSQGAFGPQEYAAKPPLLQHVASRDGDTFTYVNGFQCNITNTVLGITLPFFINPSYAVGDLIWCENVGYTGVQGPGGLLPIQDINTDGRQWATSGNVVSGLQGVAGQDGATGPQGNDGAQGPDGVQGDDGLDGVQGIQGSTGTQGSTGNQGVAGSQGAIGSQGYSGPQGIAGSAGVQGNDGNDGDTGPQGDTGDDGLDGTQGPAGVQGKSGVQGFTGVQGFQGTQGPIGVQGIQGNIGVQGIAGTNGTIGVQGIQGPQASGFQGPQGPQGSGTGGSGDTYAVILVSSTGYIIGVQNCDNTGTGTGPQVQVAIPPLLRQSVTSRGGATWSYQSGSQGFLGSPFNQIFFITPSYTVGDFIFYSQPNYTGIQGVPYQDKNVDARQWGFQSP